jgi:hypothetical protein
MSLAQAHARHFRPALPLASVLLACGSSGEDAAGSGLATRAGYEGMNFYESNADEPPSIGSLPLGGSPGSYGFVNSDEALPVCSAGVGQRARADAGDSTLACPRVTRETISDFTFAGSQSGVTFGPDAALPGGTFHYPDGPEALTSDVGGDDWHLYGTVSGTSGFGIYLNGCRQVDATAYRGIAFSLWGEIGDGGELVFFVGTAENQVASSWVNANGSSEAEPDEPVNLGRCIPLSSRYDGTCREARSSLTVLPALVPTVILWRDMGEGCPEPGVNPAEITAIAWYFQQPVSGSYTVDIHIDDLRFTDEAPL